MYHCAMLQCIGRRNKFAPFVVWIFYLHLAAVTPKYADQCNVQKKSHYNASSTSSKIFLFYMQFAQLSVQMFTSQTIFVWVLVSHFTWHSFHYPPCNKKHSLPCPHCHTAHYVAVQVALGGSWIKKRIVKFFFAPVKKEGNNLAKKKLPEAGGAQAKRHLEERPRGEKWGLQKAISR